VTTKNIGALEQILINKFRVQNCITLDEKNGISLSWKNYVGENWPIETQ